MNRIEELEMITQKMNRIGRKIIVLSGKGGVGKSMIAVNLAAALAASGRKTGLLDVDIHGPSIPKMLNMEGRPPQFDHQSIQPNDYKGMRVMSVGFLLASQDDAVIWRGPMKIKMITEFLKNVEWGELDYLIIDSPPGTGDEPLSICQLIQNPTGAVIVTTPQAVAIADVRKSISFCKKLNMPVLGVIENMSGFVCPHCGKSTEIFLKGGGRRMAEDLGVPYLGSIPIDPAIVTAGDAGTPYIESHAESETGTAFKAIVSKITG
jgi:ATP-binding protein involved in chromosome partitioning